MGGQNGDLVEIAAYTTSKYFLGVFDAAGGGLLAGVNASTSTSAGSLVGFGDFAVSKGNPLPPGKPVTAFISSASSFDGIFVQLPDGQIVTVATTKDTYGPAGGEVFNFFANPSVEVSEDLSTIYVCFDARTGSYSSGWRGIILGTLSIDGSTVSLQLVVDNSMTMPDSGATFKCISGGRVTNEGDVIFFGSQCGSTGASQMVTNQFNNLVMYRTEPVLKHALTKNHQVGVSNVHPGLWRYSSGSISVVANDLTAVPEGVSGEEFWGFSDAGIGVDGTLSFVAMGTEGSYGVYKTNGTGLSIVANNKMDVPGYSNCKFANFPQVPSVDSDGNVIFFGQCNETIAGVFNQLSGGGFGTIITYDDKVDGYSTIYVGYGSNAASGGKAALYIVLNDYKVTNGVWAFDVPSNEDPALV
jgi:hypothetical protein